MTNTLTREQAEALWDELREGFRSIESTAIEIIKHKAWEPLGYETFAAAWNVRMVGEKFANESALRVASALLDEGLNVKQLFGVKGMGAKVLQEAIDAHEVAPGVDPNRVYRKSTYAEFPSAPYQVTLQFTADERSIFAAVAKAHGTSVKQLGEAALRRLFEELANEV